MKFANPSRKDKVIATRSGHAIEFPGMKDGVPVFVHVPPTARKEVQASGMLPEDEAGFNVEEEAKTAKSNAKVAPDDADELKKVLFSAFDTMVAADDASLFTAGGLPRDKSLEKITGFEVDNTTRKEMWVEYMKEKGDK